ncbi:metallophosphoesterase [Pseudosulfitobacter pseudonitzschiae]|uniref:metallophosphoesterase n=1 Tax=Pseudosulfitobacter pseudonitzschiae TaxID=1402135 RepID=UPI003B805C14
MMTVSLISAPGALASSQGASAVRLAPVQQQASNQSASPSRLFTPVIHTSTRRFLFISDTHFFHANILRFKDDTGKLTRPGFADVTEMNELMLERWNQTVRKGDRVYHLGDVFMGQREEFQKFWPRLAGQKSLIVGNHDDIPYLSKGGFFRKVQMWRKFTEYGLMLSHVPLHESSLGWRGNTLLNVHGHIHHNDSPPGPYLNVSVEKIDYRPVELDELIETRNSMLGPLNMPSLSVIESEDDD